MCEFSYKPGLQLGGIPSQNISSGTPDHLKTITFISAVYTLEMSLGPPTSMYATSLSPNRTRLQRIVRILPQNECGIGPYSSNCISPNPVILASWRHDAGVKPVSCEKSQYRVAPPNGESPLGVTANSRPPG